MPGRILALVDGSTHSDGVCRHAAWLASRFAATVDLLHVLGRDQAAERVRSDDPRPHAPDGFSDAPVQPDALAAHHSGRALLEFASKTVHRHGTSVVNQRLWAGDLGANVAQFVREFPGQTRVIVMGRRGRSPDDVAGRLGGHVERIVRPSRDPVLVAPRAFRPIARVALALDASASARRVVEHVAASPALRGLAVRVIHAGEDTADLRARLDDACRRLTAAGLRARPEVVPGPPEAVLGGVLARDGFDLLVMGAYGHSRLRTLLAGSTTTAILQRCEVPTLLVR